MKSKLKPGHFYTLEERERHNKEFKEGLEHFKGEMRPLTNILKNKYGTFKSKVNRSSQRQLKRYKTPLRAFLER